MPRGISLHIGLNSVNPDSYGGWDGQLQACENDAICMDKLASAVGYETRKLLTKAATRAAVLSGITDATRSLAKDDIFLLSYSGHGGQIADSNGDEVDGNDETWVLYDGEVVDDELHDLYTQFKAGVRVVVLSDSCHSGTVTRGFYERIAPIENDSGLRSHATFRSKRIPNDVQAKVMQRDAAMYKKIQDDTKAAVDRTPEASVILISGCQDGQLSSDGDVNGLFTENLLKVWNEGKFEGTYRQFQKTIRQNMPPSQQPRYYLVGASNRAFTHQKPFSIETSRAARHTSAAD